MKVLVVDDEPQVMRALERLLLSSGFDASAVASGDEAMAVLATSSMGAIVTDYDMPGMNGAELLLQAQVQYPSVRRILISGDPHVVPDSAEFFFSKPIDITSLLKALQLAAHVADE